MTIALMINSNIYYGDYFFLDFVDWVVDLRADFLGSFSRPIVGMNRMISIAEQIMIGIRM